MPRKRQISGTRLLHQLLHLAHPDLAAEESRERGVEIDHSVRIVVERASVLIADRIRTVDRIFGPWRA
jgi:hypothetical protein